MNEAEERVRALVRAARRIADSGDPIGRRARDRLPRSTGLSPEGVELALARCLETDPAPEELGALCGSVQPAPRAHVLLPANVFTAAHRAIALALAASAHVEVRPSRREPEMARCLHEASGGLFRIVAELAPESGDAVFAYGADATVAEVARSLARGVVLHAYGSGMAVAVVEADADGVEQAARDLVEDVLPFDQRGCLSPRVVLALGSLEGVRRLARTLAAELMRAEARVPLGRLAADEAADGTWYRETLRVAGEIFAAGGGSVGLLSNGEVFLPPAGRNLHVVKVTDLERTLEPLAPWITAAAVAAGQDVRETVRRRLPEARLCRPGELQRPPFDGRVDRRSSMGVGFSGVGERRELIA